MNTTLGSFGSACLVGVSIMGCGGGTDDWEPTAGLEEPINIISCSTAPRDVVLNSTVSQWTGVSSPSSYDNPGCNEGFVVEFDGTVGGVHYGYRLNNPPPLSSQGIRVDFTTPGPKQLATCEGSLKGGAYLYEKTTSGNWQLLSSIFVNPTQLVNHGITTGCPLEGIVFNQVKKGSAQTPHIYRVAATMDVLDPSQFIGSYPDGQGYGPIFVHACDANNCLNGG